jgi:hypothetical protein
MGDALDALRSGSTNSKTVTSTYAGGGVYVGPGTPKQGTMGVELKDETMGITEKLNEFYTWEIGGPKYNAFVAKLRKTGMVSKTGKITPDVAAAYWVEAVNTAARYYSASNGANKITVDNVLNLFAKPPAADAATDPTRQIYKYTDENVKAMINETYQKTYTRDATPEELASLMSPTKAKLETGTLTTTKKVKNPKTGVMENVVTQTPGASTTDVQATLAEQLKQLHPEEADLTARLGFASWLSKNVQGA